MRVNLPVLSDFPKGIQCQCMPVADGDVSCLKPEELACIDKAVDKRRNEFAAGRMVAREVLAELGCKDCTIPAAESRAPIWPTAYTASISHTRKWALAAAARKGDFAAIGIDIEDLGRVLKLDYQRMVLTEHEVHDLAKSPLGEDVYTSLVFSAKEALYKAQYQLFEQWLGFQDVSLSIDAEKRQFAVTVDKIDLSDYSVHGQFWVMDDSVVSLVIIR